MLLCKVTVQDGGYYGTWFGAVRSAPAIAHATAHVARLSPAAIAGVKCTTTSEIAEAKDLRSKWFAHGGAESPALVPRIKRDTVRLAVNRFGAAMRLRSLFATRKDAQHFAAAAAPAMAPGPAPRRASEVAPHNAPRSAPQQASRTATVFQPSARMEVRRIFSDDRSPRARAHDHARRLLQWLQGQPSLVGHLVPSSEIVWAYALPCEQHNWFELPWQSVGEHFNRLTGGNRLYRRVDGQNVRVYYVPH
jgi:hypothetical protein